MDFLQDPITTVHAYRRLDGDTPIPAAFSQALAQRPTAVLILSLIHI